MLCNLLLFIKQVDKCYYSKIIDFYIIIFFLSKCSRGFGFVTYATAAELDHCQASRPHVIGGKTLETKRATPKRDSGRPEAQISVKKLFIGGLSDEMEDDDLRSYFGEYGNVINVEQLKFNDTGKKRGFGFIEVSLNYISSFIYMLHKNVKIQGSNIEGGKKHSKLHGPGKQLFCGLCPSGVYMIDIGSNT